MSKGKALPLTAAKEVADNIAGQFPLAFVAGSIRRGERKVRDIDLVVVEAGRCGTIEKLEVDGVPVQIFFTDEQSLPFMLFHATGPAQWNIVNRVCAARKGYKLNQYGLFHRESGRRVAGVRTEDDIQRALGRTVRPPQARR